MPTMLGKIRNRLFGYDAVEDRKRRKAASPVLRSEEQELPDGDRRLLVSSARDMHRNFAIAAWAIRKHLDYVSTFSFQARNADRALNRRIEDLVRWYSRRANCDVAGRHNLHRMIRIAEARRTVDGDCFLMKLSDGRLQALEGDRIRNPYDTGGADLSAFKQGVKLDKAGRAVAYSVCRRTDSGGFVYERSVRAGSILQHAYFDRFDQVRGVTPLAPALNAFRDLYEGIGYALMKAKVTQLFGLALYRQDAEIDELSPDLTKGAFVLNLRGPDQDKAEFLESKSPSVEFADFIQAMIAAAIKSLDIPYSFYAENFSTYSGSRQALLQYEQSAECKRRDVRELLDQIIAWRLGLWIADGTLQLPPGMTLPDLRWEWVPIGLPWIQPLQEAKADETALVNRLTSRQRIKKRQGEDWWEIQEELEAEEARIGVQAVAAPDNQPDAGDPDANTDAEAEATDLEQEEETQ